MTQKLRVDIREMSRDEALAVVAKHHVGDVGITFHDILRLKLCNYIYSAGWLYARTELGDNVVMARHHPWAAFQISEIDGIYDWRSVEVSGVLEFLSPDEQGNGSFEYENAVRLLQSAVPDVLTADDPMPQRVQLLRVHADNIFGRESRSTTSESLPRP